MLKKHILESLEVLGLSDYQREGLFKLLEDIKRTETLLKEFIQTDEVALSTLDGTLFGVEDRESLGHSKVQASVSTSLTNEELQTQETLAPPSTGSDTLDEALGMETLSPDALPVSSSTPKQYLRVGRYQDLGLLGKGGMGEVRKVRDETLKRNLAIKIIHPNLLKSKNALNRFTEEAQIGAQLQHPNIVPVHEFGELPDGRLYFTMKEIKGREFTDVIKEVHDASTEDSWRPTKDGVTFRQLIQTFQKICETIAFSHSLGVVHRDLKPENVMMGGFGEVLVVDWGIAKVLGASEELEQEEVVRTDRSTKSLNATRMGQVAGTPAYMSPEQAMGRIDLIGPPSDIYALGAILYEILSGNQPYTGNSAMDIVEKVKSTRPRSLWTTSSDQPTREPAQADSFEEASGKLPLFLIEICEKAMEREIEARYETASELAKDVFDWLEGAQKRDRALKEFNAAIELKEQAEQLESTYAQCWEEANDIIQKNGFEQDSSWVRWEEGESARAEALQRRLAYRKTLQGALVYDSELEEANEELAKLLLEDIISLVALGNTKLREEQEQQFNRHIQYLSPSTQLVLKQRLAQDRKDEILLRRARRGSLVGRRAQLQEMLSTIQEDTRLLSLIGTPGVGKSRLALEIIYEITDSDTQAFFCDLTEATSELGVAMMVAKAMNIKLRNVDPIGQLGEYFAEQNAILVLDNLEQVIEPAGNVITRWMEQSDTLRIIATSRIKLRLPMEHSFPMQPLTTLEGMELFTRRGRQAKPGFALQKNTRQTVGRLVTQLDKLPLAIELAAARLNISSVEDIEIRLKERFTLLRSRTKGTQALQGALDWSWDLLKPWAKAALSQASVFHGGFEINAAEDILDCGSWKEAPAVFDILQDLCEDSLLLQNKSENGDIRFGLLESIRQYSREKLTEEGAIAQNLSGRQATKETEIRHATYYSQFGTKRYLSSLDSVTTATDWNSFLDELDNFAIGSEYGTGDVALRCCMAALKILE